MLVIKNKKQFRIQYVYPQEILRIFIESNFFLLIVHYLQLNHCDNRRAHPVHFHFWQYIQ